MRVPALLTGGSLVGYRLVQQPGHAHRVPRGDAPLRGGYPVQVAHCDTHTPSPRRIELIQRRPSSRFRMQFSHSAAECSSSCVVPLFCARGKLLLRHGANCFFSIPKLAAPLSVASCTPRPAPRPPRLCCPPLFAVPWTSACARCSLSWHRAAVYWESRSAAAAPHASGPPITGCTTRAPDCLHASWAGLNEERCVALLGPFSRY